MNKKIITAFLILFMLLFAFSFQRFIFTYHFSSADVKKNISYLSSDVFKGRMAGTFENVAASSYIKSQFESSGIVPLSSTYYENFNVVYPEKIDGLPYLRILNKSGEVIKSFEYNKDFKEDTLSFKQNHISFSKASATNINNDFIKILSGNNICVFYAPTDNKLAFRSSFDANSKIALLIAVKKDVLNTIKDYLSKDNNVDCFIPYKENTANIHNVVGFISGRDSSLAPIVISAHFDHMGQDFSGNIYSGALDNASGISFVMEMSKYIKSLGIPDRNIIFVGFNAEEYGFKGSSAFAKTYYSKIKGGKIFNFDMIGGSSSVPLSIMGSKKDTAATPLIKEVSNICKESHIKYKTLFQDASDHSPFRQLGINAITFCDDDTTKIHTPNDKSQFINANSIEACYTVASKEILTSAFSKNPLVLYDKFILVFSAVGSVFAGIYVIQIVVKNKEKPQK